MQDCIDNCGCGYSTQWAIKNLFGHLDHFAMELDIIMKSYAQLTTAAPIPETSKVPFTDEEVTALWEHKNVEWVDTGFRIGELLTLQTANIDLEAGTMKGGIKTKSGKDRIVPIHSKILDIVKHRVQEDNEYLFSLNGKKMTPNQYYQNWNAIMGQLVMTHTPHECCHTFRSRLDSAGANKVCIDLMMGHKSKEVGESNLTYKNYSVPEHNPFPLLTDLETALTNQMRPANVLIILAGMYATHNTYLDCKSKTMTCPPPKTTVDKKWTSHCFKTLKLTLRLDFTGK